MDLVEQIAARGVSAVLEDSDDTDSLLEALLAWLSGDRLSDRADEHELRVQAAWEAREYFDELDVFDRFTALAILALPPDHDDRDLDTAQQLLEGHLAASRDAGEDGEELRTIADLLDHELVDEARAGELLERGSALVDPDDAGGAERFALEAQSYCVRRFIAARDAGDAGAARGWLERAETYRAWPEDPADDDPSAVLSLAEQLDIAEQWPEAAEAYGRVVRVSDPDDASVQHFAVRVGELRLLAGDPAAAAAAIEDMLPAIERRYVTALRDEDVAAAAELLAAAVDGLAVAHARLEDWSAVCRTLDRTRGLRLRRRRALREAENGAALLDLERRLHAAQRRVADSPPPAELLEAYRRLLPDEDLVPAGPDGDALAARLAPGEAAVFVAHHFAGTVAAVAARTGDGPAVTGILRSDAGTYEWLAAFAGDGDDDDGPFPFDVDAMVAAADELVGVPLGALLAELGVSRATVLAEDMLNLVPWWAVPSLDGLQVMTAGSAGELLDRQDAPPDAAPRTGLLVANPTRDLPVTGLACRGVEEALRTAGFTTALLQGDAATEAAVVGALPGRTVFHFGGHGRSDADYSALELHPDPPPDADPFPAWADGVAAWRVASGDLDPEVAEEPWSWIHRWADVEGEGRLHERHWNRGDRVDRWLERTAGTLAASYQGETCIRLSELWSGADLLVGGTLDGCRLAVLTACESATAGRGESAQTLGLPAALTFAGVGSVIGTLWPVGETVAATWADAFYAGIARELGDGVTSLDLAALVKATGEALRVMTGDEAVARIAALAERAEDPIARFMLEADGAALPDPPFGATVDWAAFYLTGAPRLDLEPVA